MEGTVVGVQGSHEGERFDLSSHPMTFGRGEDNLVVLSSESSSRDHAEIRREGDGFVVHDRGSRNGTWVNGIRVTAHPLEPGDEIAMGEDVFRFDPAAAETAFFAPPGRDSEGTLRVIVTGGGPVGLSFALLLEDMMGPRVHITIYDSRWIRSGNRLVWKTPEQGNVRRQQVVTIQSRQHLRLPREVQDRLFTPDACSEMWPSGPDSIDGIGPRNIRIAVIEDRLLELANEKRGHILLVPDRFDPVAARDEVIASHVLAIAEGGHSQTAQHFVDKFGAADPSLYSLDGKQVQDLILGLRVKSTLPDPMAVLLTVAQNRFLLNSLRGDGFLNMRLTDQEAVEAVGIDPENRIFTPCIQSEPCVMELNSKSEFYCSGHRAVFLPALLKGSGLWPRVQEGLDLFGIPPENLIAVTGFRLDMVQRSRFTAQLYPKTATTPGTFGFLIGDAANAIHFWPGRGLNSGLASVTSLARCLLATWQGRGLRDADFVRHEAVMAMLQYRHKSRAWRQMVTTDPTGNVRAIKDQIALGIAESDSGTFDRDADLAEMTERLRLIRDRLAPRLSGLPDDETLIDHLKGLPGSTIHTLLVSEPWDTGSVGGEEVDVEWLLSLAEAGAPA